VRRTELPFAAASTHGRLPGAAPGPGTGLGLRIVCTIMDNHGGRLEVEPVEGEGTTARMVLPLSDAVVPAAVRRVNEALEAVREREEIAPADR
jgi:hypothetical protein